jgi:hypothetical protein
MSFDTACRILANPGAERRRWWTDTVYRPAMGD